MKFDSQSNKIYITDEELSSYAFQRENSDKLHGKYGFIKDDPERAYKGFGTSQFNAQLEKEITIGKYEAVISAYADIISYDGLLHTVETVNSVRYFTRNLSPLSHPEIFAKAIIRAFLYSDYRNIPEIKVKITFEKESSGEKISFLAKFTKTALERMFDALVLRAHPFINYFGDVQSNFPEESEDMPFPFSSIREGQEIFIKNAFRALKRGETLLVSAPTGIGKTISVLYPTVKALNDKIDKAFYFTAKNVTGKAALDTVVRLAKYVPHLTSVNIIAKEQVCPIFKLNANETRRVDCKRCERINSVIDINSGQSISYRERELGALATLIDMRLNIYNSDIIKSVADEFNVCPYELSLDLSEYCQIIVCDYNYVIDDSIRFKRYFKNDNVGQNFAFLFDEAHNLPDRTRNTYSAKINSSVIDEIDLLANDQLFGADDIVVAADELKKEFNNIKNLCRENEYYRNTDSGEVIYGYYEDKRVPDGFVAQLKKLNTALSAYVREEKECFEVLENINHQISKILFVCTFFDDKFRFLASRENDLITIELLCIDPSRIIENMLKPAKSVIMFSATLSPIDYYREVIGVRHAETIELDSPYNQENLCIVAYDAISTRLNSRRDTAPECAEIIAETVSQKSGNYMVYFPSYDYMKRVCKLFARIMPECAIAMQRQGMSYREREKFINLFRDKTRGAVVGFCVLGGMFSEGIDLVGESLIGSIIVGTGMPMLSAERNIMEAYYNDENGRGHEFAYSCPGMNKVLQAAGRVIRTEHDRGVVVLIDDRYAEPGIKMLLPKHFRHIKYTGNLTSLSAILSDFWENKK